MQNKKFYKNKYCYLILAGKVKLPNYNFKSSEYLFNIGNSLVFEKIVKALNLNSNVNTYIAVSKLNNSFINFLPFKNATFIEVGATNTVIDSIYNAIKKIPERNISIIPITTIPNDNNIKYNNCYFGDKEIPKENWSSLKIENKKIFKFLYKSDNDSYGIVSYPFTGRITAEKLHLEKLIPLIKGKKRSDIIYLAELLFKEYAYKASFEKWFDVGHETTYMESKLSSISSRYFNNVSFHESKNMILKSSENFEKITSEYNFYKALPNNLKQYFPRVFSDASEKALLSNFQMEFIPFPNLAEIFLFKNIGPNAWIRIISSIENIYNIFYKNQKYKNLDNCSWLYSSKLKERFNSTINFIEKSNNTYLKKILNQGIYVNEDFYIESLKKTVKKLISTLIYYEESVEQFIGHGDLCFNNILVEQISGCVKLIDPKAYFNPILKINGLVDPNYDLAKLNHSYNYLYDSIVNNLFSIDFSNNNIYLKIYAPSEYEIVKKFFKEIFIDKNIEKNKLQFLTASLFLSMLPFHIDNENRMICFAILGTIAFYNLDLKKIIVQV